jgi:hypothetical protein
LSASTTIRSIPVAYGIATSGFPIQPARSFGYQLQQRDEADQGEPKADRLADP